MIVLFADQLTDKICAQAAALDDKAAADGIDAIGPLYGLRKSALSFRFIVVCCASGAHKQLSSCDWWYSLAALPVKGTCVTKDFPSCVGVGVLQHVYGRKDSDLVEILKAANAVIFGKTNVPEFACSGATLNHANGVW